MPGAAVCAVGIAGERRDALRSFKRQRQGKCIFLIGPAAAGAADRHREFAAGKDHRAAASLGTINLGHFIPDYTAYEELLDIFKAFTSIPILLDGERGYSEETAREIDIEVRRILEESTAEVRLILESRRAALEALAQRLIEKEVIDGTELRTLLEAYLPGPKLVPGSLPKEAGLSGYREALSGNKEADGGIKEKGTGSLPS